jgi:hypothetical protein
VGEGEKKEARNTVILEGLGVIESKLASITPLNPPVNGGRKLSIPNYYREKR